MNPNKKLRAYAGQLKQAADMILSRIPDTGPILGWRGFHVGIDGARDAIERLELGARGIFKDDGATESEGNEP